MRLLDLEATLVRCELRDGSEYHVPVDGLASAQGVRFLCPCGEGHALVVWFANRGVPDGIEPLPRWEMSGSSLADLTLRPSVNARCWHGFVTGGVAR